MNQKSERIISIPVSNGIKWYVAIVMIPMVLIFIPFWTGIVDLTLLNILTPILMWLPAIAGFIVLKKVIKPFSIAEYMGIKTKRPASKIVLTIIGVLIGAIALVVCTLLLSQLFGFITIDTLNWEGFRSDNPSISVAEAKEQVFQTLMLLPLYILGYMLVTTGEELGWRGFLHSAMIQQGFWKTAIFTAILWVVWHLPLIFTISYQGEISWQSATATSVNLFLTSFIISAIREKSESVWPAAFAHALLNTVILFGFKAFHIPIKSGNNIDFWGFTITGWIVWIITIILLTVKWINLQTKKYYKDL